MKRGLVLTALMFISTLSMACDVCSKQQPEALRGIAHGAGPDNSWDYLIVLLTAVVVVVSLIFSVRWLLRPGEKGEDHIKRSIFKYEV